MSGWFLVAAGPGRLKFFSAGKFILLFQLYHPHKVQTGTSRSGKIGFVQLKITLLDFVNFKQGLVVSREEFQGVFFSASAEG